MGTTLSEDLAEFFGVSAITARTVSLIAVALVAATVVAAFYVLRIRFTRKLKYRLYREKIPKVETELRALRLKIEKQEEDLKLCQKIIDGKVLKATQTLNLNLASDEVRWLVKTCQKVDRRRIQKKLRKNMIRVVELEEWLESARKEFAKLSRKLKGDELTR